MNSMKRVSPEKQHTRHGFTPTNEERSECLHSVCPSVVGVKLRRGFTLVETLIAIAILLVAIAGPMTIAARGLQTAFYAREQITAFMLAQEGVELIRSLRDQDALQHNSWLAGIPSACSGSQGCGADARGSPTRDCASKSCQLNYDDGPLEGHRGFYTYATGTLTPFTRQILVYPLPGGRETRVTVNVSWQSGLFGGVKTVTVRSRLFNQYDTI